MTATITSSFRCPVCRSDLTTTLQGEHGEFRLTSWSRDVLASHMREHEMRFREAQTALKELDADYRTGWENDWMAANDDAERYLVALSLAVGPWVEECTHRPVCSIPSQCHALQREEASDV